jgi:hypothetical protein
VLEWLWQHAQGQVATEEDRARGQAFVDAFAKGRMIEEYGQATPDAQDFHL